MCLPIILWDTSPPVATSLSLLSCSIVTSRKASEIPKPECICFISVPSLKSLLYLIRFLIFFKKVYFEHFTRTKKKKTKTINNLLKKESEEVENDLIPPLLLTQTIVNLVFLLLQNTTINDNNQNNDNIVIFCVFNLFPSFFKSRFIWPQSTPDLENNLFMVCTKLAWVGVSSDVSHSQHGG